MRILVVHHHQIPKIGEYVSGEGLRVRQLLRGLTDLGYTVYPLSSMGFSPAELKERCREQQPDIIIVTQANLVLTLAPLGIPVVFDLFAHRLMEAHFEEQNTNTTMEIVYALRQSHVILVSNDRQRWSWLGILSMLGLVPNHRSILVVPLSAQISEKRTPTEVFRLVGGGMWWPWQNPWPSLNRALDVLERKGTGEICWYGVGNPSVQHPRLRYMGRTSHHAFRRGLLSASAAFDWMEHNVEREFAIAFRHMDYLGCGLPILTGTYSPLKGVLQGAGWISDDIEGVLEKIIDNPEVLYQASKEAYACAQQFSVEKTLHSLQAWLSDPHCLEWREDNPIGKSSELWNQNVQHRITLEKSLVINQKLEDDIEKKDSEIASLRTLVENQQGSIDQLTRAVSDVVSYRKEAIQVLGGQISQHTRTAQELNAENAILRADIAKKSTELEAMDQLRARLENDIQALRVQLEKKKRLWPR